MSWAELPGCVLRAERSGHGTGRVVLLHELGGSLESFDAVTALLAPAFQVLRYDQRGAGQSEKPRPPFGMADHAADLHALLRWSGWQGPVLLVGLAAACAILAEFALAHPADVVGLLLCGPVLTATGEAGSYLRTRAERAARDGMRAVVDTSLARSYPPLLRGDAAGFSAYRARMMGNDPVGYACANMALVEATVDGRLGELRVPVDVLAGQHDLLRVPEQIAETASRIPNARFTVVESGHLMAVQTPGLVANAVHALASRNRGEPAF